MSRRAALDLARRAGCAILKGKPLKRSQVTPKQMHGAMGDIVNAPGYPLLTHYRVDFEKHDLAYLEAAWHDDARMLWVVRDSGTHLIPLGVHPRMAREAAAVFGMAGAQDYFLLSNRGVAPIDLARAKQEVASLQWSIGKDGRIFKGARHLADVVDIATRIDRIPMPGNPPGSPPRFRESQAYDVRLWPRADPSKLSLGDLIGLRIIAECAAIESGGSLMVPTRAVRLGAADLGLLMDRARAKLHRLPPASARPAAQSLDFSP